MWIPGLLFEDTEDTEKPSQTPENMGYFREYHKACERKTRESNCDITLVPCRRACSCVGDRQRTRYRLSSRPELLIPEGDGKRVEGSAVSPGAQVTRFSRPGQPRGVAAQLSLPKTN